MKSGNQSIEYVRECSKIVSQQIKSVNETINKDKDMSEQSKGGNQGNNDVHKYEFVTEAVKSGKESKCDHQQYFEIINKKL